MAGDAASWAVAALLGYLLGSIPFAALVARGRGLGDLRRIGSGNIGATNVLRTGDRAGAAMALGGDALKGVLAVLIGGIWGPGAAMAAGAAAVFGHIFPVFLRFHGGKGVATAAGSALALSWPTGLALMAVWLTMAFLTRYSSVSALAAAAAAGPLLWALAGPEHGLYGVLIGVVLWITHARNIGRLLRGEETKIGAKAS